MQFGSVSENAGLPNSYYIPKNGNINPVRGVGREKGKVYIISK